MGTKILAEETLLIDEGPYDAEIIEYEEREMKHGPTLVITFEIKNDNDFEGEEITGMCGLGKLTPNTKLWKWAKAAGCEPVVQEEFDLDDLIGEMVSINIEHQKRDGNTYHRVESVTSIRKKGKSKETEKESDDDGDAEAKAKARAKAKREKARKRKEKEKEKESDDGGDDGGDDYFEDD